MGLFDYSEKIILTGRKLVKLLFLHLSSQSVCLFLLSDLSTRVLGCWDLPSRRTGGRDTASVERKSCLQLENKVFLFGIWLPSTQTGAEAILPRDNFKVPDYWHFNLHNLQKFGTWQR